MTQLMQGFKASRKLGKRLVTVQLLASNKQQMFYDPYDITKIKKPKKIKGNFFPADF